MTHPFMTQSSYLEAFLGAYIVYNITYKFNQDDELRIGVYQDSAESLSINTSTHPARFSVNKVPDL